MRMNVDRMIRRFGGKAYTVTRQDGPGSYSETDGLFVPPGTKTLSILGLVQPLTPEEIVSIPEGDRVRERFRFYTSTPLKNSDTVAKILPDVVDIDGVLYEVESVAHWANHGKVIIARQNRSDN